jgi:CBS domain-containing protein
VAAVTAVTAFERMHHRPVVDEAGMLVGMVSALDVLDWMARNAGYIPADGTEGRIFERPGLPTQAPYQVFPAVQATGCPALVLCCQMPAH